ncbi:type VI secretion system-associated protein TagF [Paracoccus onubensis]|uniref:Type VI secretion system-associated protein TagF n=1 Tax=Paracoccus onubensis TaxID=1675788 RepID=A0A418T3Y7_9RHOB|nr:type VI secretion system-associated protein TagF [Paracoccus onubensis]RJE87912.1 type VI secretion system-associated protein TagF [Paracoccus onubensis]
MSAEHRLNVAGIYGKHPGFGDFIASGLPDSCLNPLGDWMQAALGEWRAQVGESWQNRFDLSPRLNFWIGPALLGGEALRGIWTPSHDRTGRRFPLIVAQVTTGPAPVIDPSQEFHMAASAALTGLLDSDGFDPRDVANRLQSELPGQVSPGGQPGWPTFWALNPELGPETLLENLRSADHAHAVTARSYWWFADDSAPASGVLGCQGLPGLSELDWLLAGGGQAGTAPGGEDVA